MKASELQGFLFATLANEARLLAANFRPVFSFLGYSKDASHRLPP